jgi:endonuclease III
MMIVQNRAGRSAIDITEMLRLLTGEYGRPAPPAAQRPLDELVMTILSQHTSDSNTARAYASLRSRFSDWESAAHARTEEIADAIRTGGLANVKAATIKSVLLAIQTRTGQCDLDWIETMSTDDARSWLTSLHGVGPKTAACVLLFSLGRPVMPVDTHVHRVSIRLGIIPARTSAERAHEILERHFTAESMYDAHMLLIQHGRITCTARAPKCDTCILAQYCPGAGTF